MYGTSNRELILQHPRNVTIRGGETVKLEWIDRRTQIPNRKRELKKVINLMAQSGGHEEWKQLPTLLKGLRMIRKPVSGWHLDFVLRKIIEANQFQVLLHCVRNASQTGMSLKQPEVLEAVLWSLHLSAQAAGWSEAATMQAIKNADFIAMQLQSSLHGGGENLSAEDARRKPETLGLYLELVAVLAHQHRGAIDTDGNVGAYSERLLANIEADGATTVCIVSPRPLRRARN